MSLEIDKDKWEEPLGKVSEKGGKYLNVLPSKKRCVDNYCMMQLGGFMEKKQQKKTSFHRSTKG